MSEFEKWVERNRPNWRPKNGYGKVVLLAPNTKLLLSEYVVDEWFRYHPKEPICAKDDAELLYSLVEKYMSIDMEKELIKILDKNVRDWEERYEK